MQHAKHMQQGSGSGGPVTHMNSLRVTLQCTSIHPFQETVGTATQHAFPVQRQNGCEDSDAADASLLPGAWGRCAVGGSAAMLVHTLFEHRFKRTLSAQVQCRSSETPGTRRWRSTSSHLPRACPSSHARSWWCRRTGRRAPSPYVHCDAAPPGCVACCHKHF